MSTAKAKKQIRSWVAIGAGGIVILLGITWWFLFSRLPSVPEMIPDSPVAVTLTRPFNGVTYSLASPIEVRGEAVGNQKVVSLTLFDNGEPVSTQEPDPFGYNAFKAKWLWRPAVAGVHILTLQATLESGQQALSGPLWVKTTLESNALAMENYTAAGGETLEEIAQQENTSLPALLRYNSSKELGEVLEAGEEVTLPVYLPDAEPLPEPVPVQDPAVSGETPGEQNSNLISWVNSQVSGSSDRLPPAPGMSGSVVDCTPQLTIRDYGENEDGFLIYRISPGSSTGEVVASLKAFPGTGTFSWSDSEEYSGTAAYSASAYNGRGESSHPGVVLEVDAACSESEWEGVEVENGYLQLPGGVSLAYIYLSVDGSQTIRFPAADNQFLPQSAQGFDLNPILLPVLENAETSPVEVSLQAWGWKGGVVELLAEGTGSLVPHLDEDLITTEGGPELVMNSVAATWGDLGGETLETEILPFEWWFRYYPYMTGIDSARWQISLMPLPAAPVVAPPGLIAEGEISGTKSSLGFSIDFESLLLKPDRKTFTELGSEAHDFFIRVLLFKDGQPVAVTNTVVGHYMPEEQQEFQFPAPIYEVEIVEFRPPDFPDPNRWGCVVVTGIAEGVDPDQFGFMGAGWFEIGKEFCPEPWQGDAKYGWEAFWDDLSSFVVDAINWVADTYNGIKQFAVNLVVDILPCDELGVAGACDAIVEAALNYGMAALGLPPTLPDFDALVEMGKGEIVAVATEYTISQVPGGDTACGIAPCEELLDEAFGKAMDAGIEMLEKESVTPGCVSEEEAHAHGVEPLCPSPLVITKPAPGASYSPPIVVLEITKINEDPENAPLGFAGCALEANMAATNYFEGGREYGPSIYEYVDVQPQTISGQPYQPEYFSPPPGMKVGETETVFVTFERVQNYLLPWNASMYADSQIAPNYARNWQTLLYGGKVSVTVGPLGGGGSLPCAYGDRSEELPARIYWKVEE